MSKLSLEALQERADAVASSELLNAISGGKENTCHDTQEIIDSLNDAQCSTSKQR